MTSCDVTLKSKFCGVNTLYFRLLNGYWKNKFTLKCDTVLVLWRILKGECFPGSLSIDEFFGMTFPDTNIRISSVSRCHPQVYAAGIGISCLPSQIFWMLIGLKRSYPKKLTYYANILGSCSIGILLGWGLMDSLFCFLDDDFVARSLGGLSPESWFLLQEKSRSISNPGGSSRLPYTTMYI